MGTKRACRRSANGRGVRHTIWHFAVEVGAAIITKDEDFAQRKTLSDAGPAVIWIRLPNTRRRDLLAWFGLALPNVVLALERGETLVEVV